jgi:uncharacterized protein YcbX
MTKRILSEIWIYPVKSLGGIRLSTAMVLEKGLVHDRRWMLVDENNVFMTQRVFPALALFKTRFQAEGIEIWHGSDSVRLPKKPLSETTIHSEVWGSAVTTLEVSEQLSQWFSSSLDMRCKLVAFPEENARPVEKDYAINHENVSLADGYPLLIIGQASLDDLNKRLREPVPMNRFRPNLVFTGGVPYEEDEWRRFMVGGNRFAGVKPCSRCVMTTVNQDTGIKGHEPLATLSGYRKREGEVYFGQNVVAIDHHEINEGDEITF